MPAQSDQSPYVAPDASTLSADGRRSRIILFVSLAVVGCLADLLSKHYVFAWLGPPNGSRNIYWIVEDYVGLETALNFGALFGMGQNMVWFFATMSFVALGGITLWLSKYRAIDDWVLTLTLGMVTGGILGNLYDRLGIWSDFTVFAVRDWIRLSYQSHVWPNFNIADSLLVCGAALLFLHSLKNPDSAAAAKPEQLADAA